jgi:hypothetical protein
MIGVAAVWVTLAAVAASGEPPAAAPGSREAPLLPTGVRLDPAGPTLDVGAMPLALALAPGGEHAVLLLNGWRERGLEVVDLRSGRAVQRLEQPAAFLGLAFAPDGRTLVASGGNEDGGCTWPRPTPTPWRCSICRPRPPACTVRPTHWPIAWPAAFPWAGTRRRWR